MAKKLLNFANTSIDISDGLFADLDKLINKQKLSYKISLTDVPISKKLKDLMLQKKLKKLTSYLKVMIIKYYLLHLRKKLESLKEHLNL